MQWKSVKNRLGLAFGTIVCTFLRTSLVTVSSILCSRSLHMSSQILTDMKSAAAELSLYCLFTVLYTTVYATTNDAVKSCTVYQCIIFGCFSTYQKYDREATYYFALQLICFVNHVLVWLYSLISAVGNNRLACLWLSKVMISRPCIFVSWECRAVVS